MSLNLVLNTSLQNVQSFVDYGPLNVKVKSVLSEGKQIDLIIPQHPLARLANKISAIFAAIASICFQVRRESPDYKSKTFQTLEHSLASVNSIVEKLKAAEFDKEGREELETQLGLTPHNRAVIRSCQDKISDHRIPDIRDASWYSSHQIVNSTSYASHRDLSRTQMRELTPEEQDRDWHLQDYFGSVFVINLPSETERLNRVSDSLKKIGVSEFMSFKATNGRDGKQVERDIWNKMRPWTQKRGFIPDRIRQGEVGCYISHLRVVQEVNRLYEEGKADLIKAKQVGDQAAEKAALDKIRKYRSVVILESDNGFGIVTSNKATLKTAGQVFRKAMANLPEQWDMLYFMTRPEKKEKSTAPHLVNLSYGIMLNAYVVNHTMYRDVMTQLEKLYDPNVTGVKPVDHEIAALHENHSCFAIDPAIAYQTDGVSGITTGTKRVLHQDKPVFLKHVIDYVMKTFNS